MFSSTHSTHPENLQILEEISNVICNAYYDVEAVKKGQLTLRYDEIYEASCVSLKGICTRWTENTKPSLLVNEAINMIDKLKAQVVFEEAETTVKCINLLGGDRV